MLSAGEEVAASAGPRGLAPRPYGGAYDHLYIDIYPPELQVDAGAHVLHRQRMRPVSDDGMPHPSDLPLPRARRKAPLVYVTMGTVFNDPEPLRLAVEGVHALQVRVLATVGPAADPVVLGTQPRPCGRRTICATDRRPPSMFCGRVTRRIRHDPWEPDARSSAGLSSPGRRSIPQRLGSRSIGLGPVDPTRQRVLRGRSRRRSHRLAGRDIPKQRRSASRRRSVRCPHRTTLRACSRSSPRHPTGGRCQAASWWRCAPGGVFVVEGVVAEAAVEDADESVGEGS